MADLQAAPMTGKTILITGGTGGIGYATALGLARLGARVGIVGRDLGRAQAAAASIAAAAGSAPAGSAPAGSAPAGSAPAGSAPTPGRLAAVDAFAADMSSQAEVRRLAREVLSSYPRLEVLINNMGGFYATRKVTADGLEHTFAVNHLAGFLLTDLLLDRLKASAPARIVTVSSGVHGTGQLNFDDLQGTRGYSGPRAYSQSKLANIMFTYELARRVAGTGVTANVLHPGVVRTGFAAEDPNLLYKVLLPLVRPFFKTPAQGALTSVYLASSPEIEGVTGQYFVNRKPVKSSKSSYDTAAASRLWQVSTELVAGSPGG